MGMRIGNMHPTRPIVMPTHKVILKGTRLDLSTKVTLKRMTLTVKRPSL